MSRKSLEYLCLIVVVASASAWAQSSSCLATYFPSSLFSSESTDFSKNQALNALSNKMGATIKDIASGSLKDFLSIRAQAAQLECGAVFILQKSRDVEGSLISAVFISTQNGQTIAESAFPGKKWKDEFISWINAITPEQREQALVLHTTDLIAELARLKRCEDLHRFLSEDKANMHCQAGGSVIKSAPLKDPFKLVMSGAPFAVKKAWIDTLENSAIYEEGRKVLTKTAEIRVSCEEDCKQGEITLTIFVTRDFLAGSANPMAELSSLTKKLMESRNDVARSTKTKMLPLNLILRSPSGAEMEIRTEGNASSPKLFPSQSVQSFIQKN